MYIQVFHLFAAFTAYLEYDGINIQEVLQTGSE